MKITVDNVDLGPESRDVTDPAEQIKILCAAICHGDQEKGWEVRALKALAFAIIESAAPFEGDGKNVEACRALLDTAAVLVVEGGHKTGEVVAFFNDAIGICVLAGLGTVAS
jgi:hypothetical protein